MTDKRLWPLTFQGSDVGLRARFADGRVRVVYLDRDGRATASTVTCQAFQLRGRHLAEIKTAVAMLPLEGEAAAAATTPPPPRRPPRLHAHYVADALEREEQ